jgi:hypothetical protein
MYMVGHDFQFKNFTFTFCANLTDYFCQAFGNFVGKHLTPILWTPDNMVLARVHNVVVGLEIPHTNIIPQGVI